MVLVAKPKRAVSPHQKKRTGQHHRVSKHYSKPYLPYLPIVAIIALGFVCSAVLSRGVGGVLGVSANSITASSLLQATNKARSSDHENSLKLNSQLMQAAQAKARDMAARNYWSHNTPNGATPWTFIRAAGYSYAVAGENLAYGFASTSAVTTAWLSSPEHRANLLQDAYQDVGFGIVQAAHFQGHGAETIVVALYGEPSTAATSGQALAGVSTTSRPSTPRPQLFSGEAQNIAQLQMLSGSSASWMIAALMLTAIAAVLMLAVRHTRAWHRVLVRGESLLLAHPALDIALAGVAVAAVVLTRAAGSIY